MADRRLKLLTNTYPNCRTVQCGSCMNDIELAEPGIRGRTISCRCGQRLELVSYRAITDPDELERYLVDNCVPAPSTSFDYETTGLNVHTCKIVGVSFGPENRLAEAIYVPVRHRIGTNMDPEAMKRIVAPFIEQYPVNVHGADFEYRISVLHFDVEPNIVCDTMIEAYLDDTQRKSRFDIRGVGLKGMGEELFEISTIDFKDLIDPKRQDFSFFPVDQATIYGCQDSDLTTRLKRHLYYHNAGPPEAGGQPYVHYLEHELIAITAGMELRGVLLDVEMLEAARPELMDALDVQYAKIRELAGDPELQIDVTSPSQVADLLFNKMLVPFDPDFIGKSTKAWPSGMPGTGKKALDLIKDQYEIVRVVLETREIHTALSGYVDKLPGMVSPEDNVLRTSFIQNGTVTNRYAGREPNLMAISKVRD